MGKVYTGFHRSLFYGKNLSMGTSKLLVVTFSNNISRRIHNNGANKRIGFDVMKRSKPGLIQCDL
jgi:hypothetical protein